MSNYVWKQLLPYGTYKAPRGTVCITPERVQHWMKKFKSLRDKGVRFPCPWGHRVEAIPIEQKVYLSALDGDVLSEYPDTEAQFSKFNATYIDDMEARIDGLYVKFCPPPGYRCDEETGDLVNDLSGTRIGEMSAGIGNWIDGSGKHHKDIIMHAAFVPLPVVHNQEPFEATLSTQPTNASFFLTLSTSKRSDEMPHDKEEKEEMKDMETEGGDEKETKVEEKMDTLEDVMGETPVDEPEDDDLGITDEDMEVEMDEEDNDITEMSTDGVDNNFEEAVSLFKQLGLDIKDGIQKDEFFSYIVPALRMALSMGAKFSGKEEKEGAGEEGMKMNTMEPYNGTDANVSAEAPPLLMSTAQIKDPIAKKLALQQEKVMRKKITRMWQENIKNGCPSHVANREIASVEQVNLSLNSKTGEAVVPEAMKRAKLVYEVLKKSAGAASVLTQELSTAAIAEPKNPESHELNGSGEFAGYTDGKSKTSDVEIVEALRRGAGLPPKK